MLCSLGSDDPRGKPLILRMVVEAISGSNAPAVNWGTSLERPGSSPDLPPMEKAIISGGSHGSAQAVASLGHLLPSWNVKLMELTRKATAEKNPTGDVQYCSSERSRVTELPEEAGTKDSKRDR